MGIRGKELKPPRFVYRYFDQEEHAAALLQGRVWLSTISSCRTCDGYRADKEEGILTWNVPDIGPGTAPERVTAIQGALEESGAMSFGAGANPRIERFAVYDVVDDGYLFCTSLASTLSNFGGYCVQIADPVSFFCLVTRKIEQCTKLRGNFFAPMEYGGRVVNGDTGHSRHPALVGPEANAKEREARMCWLPEQTEGLRRFELVVPEVAALCSRVR